MQSLQRVELAPERCARPWDLALQHVVQHVDPNLAWSDGPHVTRCLSSAYISGARRNRTADLLVANYTAAGPIFARIAKFRGILR